MSVYLPASICIYDKNTSMCIYTYIYTYRCIYIYPHRCILITICIIISFSQAAAVMVAAKYGKPNESKYHKLNGLFFVSQNYRGLLNLTQ